MTNVIKLSKHRASQKKAEAHPADDLSFMKRRVPRGTGIDYWNVEPTGGYGFDYQKGKELAGEYLDYLGRYPTNGNTTLLSGIVTDMFKHIDDRGSLSGIEIGFLNSVNKVTLFGAAVLQGSEGGAA